MAKQYKSMTYTQLADCAGVTRRTLYNWLRGYRDKLRRMGVKDKAKVLPPVAVRYICKKFYIEV